MTGCGGDGSGVRADEFVASANAQCRRLAAAGEELNAASDLSVTGDAVASHLHRATDILRGRLRRIDALVPPDALQDSVSRMISKLEDFADGLDALADEVTAGQSFPALEQAHPEQVTKLNELTTEVNAIAASIGLQECISGTP